MRAAPWIGTTRSANQSGTQPIIVTNSTQSRVPIDLGIERTFAKEDTVTFAGVFPRGCVPAGGHLLFFADSSDAPKDQEGGSRLKITPTIVIDPPIVYSEDDKPGRVKLVLKFRTVPGATLLKQKVSFDGTFYVIDSEGALVSSAHSNGDLYLMFEGPASLARPAPSVNAH